jgi:hypothetical protein
MGSNIAEPVVFLEVALTILLTPDMAGPRDNWKEQDRARFCRSGIFCLD